MSDYIGREAALDALRTVFDTEAWDCTDGGHLIRYEDAECALKEITAADVRPVVRGEWLLDTVYPSGVKKFRCSICGYDRTVHERYEGVFQLNFCPNCGADMRSEGKGSQYSP